MFAREEEIKKWNGVYAFYCVFMWMIYTAMNYLNSWPKAKYVGRHLFL